MDLALVPIFGRSGLEINHSPAGAVEEHQVGAAFHQPPLRQADCNRKFAVELAGRKRSPQNLVVEQCDRKFYRSFRIFCRDLFACRKGLELFAANGRSRILHDAVDYASELPAFGFTEC